MNDAEPIHVCKRADAGHTVLNLTTVIVECSCGWQSAPIHPSSYHWVVFVHRRALHSPSGESG